MKPVKDIENKLKELKPFLADKFHVRRIGYFGSYASGLQNSRSDLDLLVEFSEPVGWDFFTLEKFLEQEFELNIDLVTQEALKDRIRKPILNLVKFV